MLHLKNYLYALLCLTSSIAKPNYTVKKATSNDNLNEIVTVINQAYAKTTF